MTAKIPGNLNLNGTLYAFEARPISAASQHTTAKGMAAVLLVASEMQIEGHITQAAQLPLKEFGKLLKSLRILCDLNPVGMTPVVRSATNLSAIENGTRGSSQEKRIEILKFIFGIKVVSDPNDSAANKS